MPIIRIIKNYNNTLHNSGNVESLDIGGKNSSMPESKKAWYGLFKTITVITLIAVAYVSFVKPKHSKQLAIFNELANNDIPVPEEFFLKEETLIVEWFESNNYQSVVDYCERNPVRHDHYEEIMLALSYMEVNDLPSAIKQLNKISNISDNPYCLYAEYKKAYLYILLHDVKGIEILEKIIKDPKHPYCKQAVQFINTDVCKVLYTEKGKKGFLENN